MIKKLQERYSLTENGAKGLLKASISVFFKNFSFLLPAMLIMFFVDNVVEDATKSPWYYTVIILIIAVLMYIITHIDYNTNYTETYKESANLRIEIADVLKDLPLSYFTKHDISDLSQTVMQDVADIEHALCHAIPQFIGFLVFFIVVSVMLIIGNWQMGLCIVLPIVTCFLLVQMSKKMQIDATSEYYQILRRNSESFQQAIEMQQEIKAYGLTEQVEDDLMEKVTESEKIHIKSEFKQAIPVSGIGTILKFSLGLTIVVGTKLLIQGEVSLLYLLGYIIASCRIVDAVTALFANMAEIMYMDARIERIRSLRTEPIQVGEQSELSKYDIEFKNVSFSYDGERDVVDGISFVAKQNEVTALVGPSGCGKTSVLRLMSRLYDYDKGEIIIDGKDISKVDTENLFEKISIVFQDVTLFDTSVMENIRIGNKNASDEEVIAAAKMANCHQFIENLPDKYDTIIGENGSKLSGGERQRISIARAFLKNAPIILLDEISASLDVENEMQIQESLNSLIKNKTVVIVSHRLKSIENANKIIVMNNGKIDNMGTHAHLMQSSKLYHSMIQKANMTADYVY
ncbi:MAG: ABC transporter ATP-binding protein [Peptostreptococcaceae bacterium]|nr:ABC transporter ATP-binding protein [Peptostreptococcaceae bacterium]